MSFSDTFALPVHREAGGATRELPVLTTRDYLPWIQELNTTRRAEATALIPAQIKPLELHQAKRVAAGIECTPDDIGRLLPTGDATIRVLELACRKSGMTDQNEINRFIDSATHRENTRDAYRVSGLFTKSQLYQLFPDEVPTFVDQLLAAADRKDAAELQRLATEAVKVAEPEPEKEDEGPNDESPEALPGA